jgi:hypothetical protein
MMIDDEVSVWFSSVLSCLLRSPSLSLFIIHSVIRLYVVHIMKTTY